MRTTTEAQRRLITLGFLPAVDPDTLKPSDDGTFGTKSFAALNRYLASKGKPPIVPADLTMQRINAVLFPEEQPVPAPPASNPITDYLTRLAVNAAIFKLKGLPMLTGYKTFATAAVIAVMAVYSILFGDLPLVGHVDPGSAIMALLSSLGLSFARVGAKTEANK